MSTAADVPPRRWRTVVAAVGIGLLAFSARTALTATSPITEAVLSALHAPSALFSILGTLSALVFAAAGFAFAPVFARYRPAIGAFGCAATIAVALALRAFSAEPVGFAVLSVIALAGMGGANILLPALARTYFPHRIGLATSLSTALIALSTATPPVLSERIGGADWRLALVVWAVVAAITTTTWLVLAVTDRAAHAPRSLVRPAQPLPPRVWRVGVIFSISAGNAFAMFASMPVLLREVTGMSSFDAATMLALYAFMALPVALAIPAFANRMRSSDALIIIGSVAIVIGNVLLITLPADLIGFGVVVAGSGQLLYPTAMVMIARSSADAGVTARFSGRGQAIGYALGATAPALLGLAHGITHSWRSAMIVLTVASACAAFGVLIASRRNPYREPSRDDLSSSPKDSATQLGSQTR